MLRPFKYLVPATLPEAVAMQQAHYPAGRVLAGGTALLLALERGQATAETIIDLNRLQELREISSGADDEIKIGALVTLREIVDSGLVSARVPVLGQTVRQMATPQVRNLATIGGNIASGLPGADLAVTLLALNAKLLFVTHHDERRMSLNQFLARASMVSQRAEGFITAILIPRQPGQASYQKLMVRRAVDVPLANVAVWAHTEAGAFADVRIVVGACNGRPERVPEAEAVLIDQPVTRHLIDHAAKIVMHSVVQDDDRRASGQYRCRMASVLARRALAQLERTP